MPLTCCRTQGSKSYILLCSTVELTLRNDCWWAVPEYESRGNKDLSLIFHMVAWARESCPPPLLFASVAKARAGPKILRAGELFLPLPDCNTQESLPGQHNAAALIGQGMGWAGRAGPTTHLLCGGMGKGKMPLLCPLPFTTCGTRKSWPSPYQLQHLGK